MTSIQKQTRPFGQPLKNKQTGDGGRLYHTSHSLLLAREDKTYPGAMIASLSIPWGESRGDDDIGGYHLVWTRDMVNSATGLLAAGKTETPLRSLIYLACSQLPDGAFTRTSGSTAIRTGPGFSWTKSRFRSCWRGDCTKRARCAISIPIPWSCALPAIRCDRDRRPRRNVGRKTAGIRPRRWLPTSPR